MCFSLIRKFKLDQKDRKKEKIAWWHNIIYCSE